MDIENIDESLLAKFLTGEASPEEAIAVNDWIEASEKNKTHFDQIKNAWLLCVEIDGSSVNKNLEWTKLYASINRPKTSTGKWTIGYKIAASILLIIGVGTIGYLFKPTPLQLPAWNVKQTSNEVANLNLPDGSAVTVNRNSVIEWPNKPTSNVREVRLKGEAFFDVSHNPEKPFVVSTDEVKIKVLGTVFNVMNSASGSVETEVIRGKVMMYTSSKQIIIDGGMKGVYDKATRELRLVKLESENNVAYATHVLTFKSISLKEVCDHLGKTYGVQFFFENKKVEQCTLTSAYSNKSLSFIMDVISESLGITYQIKGNSVYISGDGCL